MYIYADYLFFSDFRIEGVCQNKMWFYSIQGLFEVVFHYHKRDVQKDCLKLLAVGIVWLNKKKKNPNVVKRKFKYEQIPFTSIH